MAELKAVTDPEEGDKPSGKSVVIEPDQGVDVDN
jgi:hypothetical protein